MIASKTASERPATLCEAFQRTAAIDPDAVALRTPGGTQTMTWRQYAADVRRVAAGLAGLGVRRGDTVSLMMANRCTSSASTALRQAPSRWTTSTPPAPPTSISSRPGGRYSPTM